MPNGITLENLNNKCADINYLYGSARPFTRDVGNFFVERTNIGYSICKVLNEQGGIRRVVYGMTKTECMWFLLGLEYGKEEQ